MSEEARSEEREKAEFQSIGCPVCRGAGMVIVFHHRWTGSRFVTVTTLRNGELVEESFPGEVSAHCFCKLGQWMRAKTPEFLRARIPDGADIAEGRSLWSFQPPGDAIDPHIETYTRAAFERFFGAMPAKVKS